MKVADVMVAVHATERDVPTRVRQILALAPVLVPCGVPPERLAASALFGGWSGEESANYEALRTAYVEASTDGDPDVEAVRVAGVASFERARRKALGEERRRDVSGELD